MDPMQLAAMQEQAGFGLTPGIGIMPGMSPGVIPGMLAPTGGIGMFSALTNPGTSQFQPSLAGGPLPDVSPLAPFNLQQHGLPGMLAGMVGNTMLTNAMQRQGVLSYGNAASYMQAYRTRDHLQMRQDLSKQLASKDAEGFYRSFRGAAALAGQPFNAQQRRAARNVSKTLAEFGPMLAGLAPDMMDAMAGERGSVQVLANQVTDANRYRIDPSTGRMGYSTESNKELIDSIYSNMFRTDNLAKMKGVRAGDVGQLYRELSGEGLAGPQGGLRDRTLSALREIRGQGKDLTALGDAVGVGIGANTDLNKLSDRDLTKLRSDSTVQSKLSKAEASQVTRQLQSYVDSVASMREIFGENGNLNAPMSQLINGLKALTSGQMQKFDATQLNMMVRDVQSMSQLSGKSIDQVVAMNQLANQQNAATLGRHGVYFNMAGTRTGTTTGMAMQQQGAPVGFGALNRTEAEQLAIQDHSRSLGSEMFNALGALTRIERRGGFAKNTAGQELRAIMSAIDSGADKYTYTDENNKTVTKNVPLQEAAFRALIERGAAQGMSVSDFNRELGYRTSNIRTMAETPGRQSAVFAQQANELNQQATAMLANRLSTTTNLTQIADPQKRATAAQGLGAAVMASIDSLPMDAITDQKKRETIVATALKREAANRGVSMNDAEATLLAGSALGEVEEYTQKYTGKDLTAHLQTKGKRVRQEAAGQDMLISARSSQNQAMSGLGRQGGIMQRMFVALQRQGDRGTQATMETFLSDALGGGMDIAAERLSKPMQGVKALNNEIETLTSQLSSASPEDRVKINTQIKEKSGELTRLIGSVRGIADEFGLAEGKDTFNMTDIGIARQARRELHHLGKRSSVASIVQRSKISEDELKTALPTRLTPDDLRVIAADDISKQIAGIEASLAKPKLEGDFKTVFDQVRSYNTTDDAALQRTREIMLGQVGTEDQRMQVIRNTLGNNLTVGALKDPEIQKLVVKSRRAAVEVNPAMAQVTARAAEVRRRTGLPAQKTEKELEKMTADEKNKYREREQDLLRTAEDMLITENQLRVIGEIGRDDTLFTDPAKIKTLDAGLKKELYSSKSIREKTKMASQYIDSRVLQEFSTTMLPEKDKIKGGIFGWGGVKVQDKAHMVNERRRREAISTASSEEGRLLIESKEKNIAALSNVTQEYLNDPLAIKRGGHVALDAINASQAAEKELQVRANKFYGGSIGTMLAQPFAMTAEGVSVSQQEFSDVLASGTGSVGYKDVVAKLTARGYQFDKNKLKLGDYLAYLHVVNEGAVDNMGAAAEALESAARGKYTDTRLSKFTPAQAKAMEGMERQLHVNVKEEAGNLGISQEAYRRAITASPAEVETAKKARQATKTRAKLTDTLVDPAALLLFKGKDSGARLREARTTMSGLNTATAELRGVEKELITNPESFDLKQTAKNLRNEIAAHNSNLANQMRSAGFDSSVPADVTEYGHLLDNQGTIADLESRRTSFHKLGSELKKSGVTTEQINTGLGAINEKNVEVTKRADEIRNRHLGSDHMNALADAFGKKTADERQKFKSVIDSGGGGPADDRNRGMLAAALKTVSGFTNLGKEGATSIQKLDVFVDDWLAAKSPDEQKTLAKKYGTTPRIMEQVFKQAEFLNLDASNKDLTEQDLRTRLDSVRGQDIAAQIKQEADRSIRITGGTLDVTGVINGQGTFSNTTGVSGR